MGILNPEWNSLPASTSPLRPQKRRALDPLEFGPWTRPHRLENAAKDGGEPSAFEQFGQNTMIARYYDGCFLQLGGAFWPARSHALDS